MNKADDIPAEAAISALILRGISVSNPISKNEIMRKIYNIWTSENLKFGQVLKVNKSKIDDLNQETKNYENLLKQYKDMQINTSFFSELKRNYHSKAKNLNLLVDSIKNLENQIHPNEKSKPLLLDSIQKSKTSNEVKQLQLLDLFYRRSEELSYLLKRKIIDIEHSHFVSQHIKEHRFPSVFRLIDTYNIVKEENDALKIDESAIFTDSILKRRKVSQFSNAIAGNVALIYQNDFSANRNFLQLMNKAKLKVPKQSISIDEIFKDPLFDIKSTDFSLDFSSNKIMASQEESIQSKLNEYQSLYKDLEKSCNELEQGLKQLRSFKFSSNNQAKGNIEKLWDLNDRLFGEIQKEEDYIDSSILIERNLCKQIMDSVQERCECSFKYTIAYNQYLSLIREHSKLINIVQHNKAVTLSLFKIALSFALKGFLDSMGNEILDNYFTNFFKIDSPPVISDVDTTIITPKSSPQKSLLNIMSSKKKKKSSSIKSKQQQTPDDLSPKVVKRIEKTINGSPLFSLTKLESLILICYCLKHSGFLINFNNSPHDVIKKTFDSILSVGYTRVAQFLQDFSNEFFPNISLIRDLLKPFLIVETTEKTIQTEPPKFVEAEVQTIDPKILKESMATAKKKK